MYGWRSSCYSFHAHSWFSLYRLWWSIFSWRRRGEVNHRQETIRFTSAMIKFIGIRRRNSTTTSDGSWWSWTIRSISFSISCLANVSVEIWRDSSFVIKKPVSCFQQFRCTFLTVYCDMNQKMITCLNLFVFFFCQNYLMKTCSIGSLRHAWTCLCLYVTSTSERVRGKVRQIKVRSSEHEENLFSLCRLSCRKAIRKAGKFFANDHLHSDSRYLPVGNEIV